MAEAPQHIEKRNQFIGAIGSLSIHAAIILLLFYWTLTTPIPPYPEGGGGQGSGIEINLGYSETGLGQVQENELTIPEDQPEKPKTTASQDNENIMTQEVEEVDPISAVTTKKETKKAKPVEKPTPLVKKPEKTQVVEKPVVKKPVVNNQALYKPRTSNQGNTQAGGDQGSTTGNPASPTYKGAGKGGTGDEGSGGGTGGGIGTGSGKGKGPGPTFNLDGRTQLSLPKPEYNTQVEGDVVVEVVVDKEGRVTTANPGYKGSTTLDENLLQLAKRAALLARFDRKPNAPAFQRGTITYKFRLQ